MYTRNRRGRIVYGVSGRRMVLLTLDLSVADCTYLPLVLVVVFFFFLFCFFFNTEKIILHDFVLPTPGLGLAWTHTAKFWT